MKVDMLMPQMGESIAEATIVRWVKQPGEMVRKDETILEISTDKVDSEIPAPASGVLTEVLFKEGDVVPVKVKIAVIDSEAKAGATASASTSASSSSTSGAAQATVAAEEAPAMAIAANAAASSSKQYSPLVKSLAEKHGVALAELDNISGTGEGGRINKQDFLRYVETRGAATTVTPSATAVAPSTPAYSAPAYSAPAYSAPAAAPAPTIMAPPAKAPTASTPVINDWAPDGTKIIPMDGMRQAIADHMVRSKHTSPHVYSIQEVDCSAISKWRAKNQAEFVKSEGFKLSFTPFFLEAAVKGLAKFPFINASVQEKKIILKKHVNLGCAVALENAGLIVPVIKKAEEKNLVGLARSLNDLALRARNKKLLPDDVAGGTFTITNPGIFGTMIGTPIISQPQVAILCLGAIEKRPVVINDMIGIREMCYLTLSYDHRIIDGSLGGQFLAFVREYLENWDINRPVFS